MYYLYNIIFKIKYNNIYYLRIQHWSVSFFVLFVSQIMLFVSSLIFDIPNIYKTFYSIDVILGPRKKYEESAKLN